MGNFYNIIVKKIKAFIPHHISNRVLLRFLEVLTVPQKLWLYMAPAQSRVEKALIEGIIQLCVPIKEKQEDDGKNSCVNSADTTKSPATNTQYIENQLELTNIAYGKHTMAYCGCEVIALYNALLSLGLSVPLDSLIKLFEKRGIILKGLFGTSPIAIYRILNKLFPSEYTSKISEFESFAQNHSGLIMTLYNNKDDIASQIHTVFVEKSPEGFIVHNYYGNGKKTEPFTSIEDMFNRLNKGRVRGISLMGIKA